MKRRDFLFLFFIVLIATLLRFWGGLSSIPQGFQIDEAAFGYNSYSLMLTGKDEYGVSHPATLRSFNDYKAALYSYVDIPFIKVMGLSETTVRMPSALLGIGFIIIVFFLSLELTKRKDISFIVSALCAISPTLIFQNRIQSDPVLSVFLVMLGIYLFVLWIRKNSNYLLICSFISFFLSTISYQFPRIFLILFFPFLVFNFRNKIKKENYKLILVLGIILFLLIGKFLLAGTARSSQTSILSIPNVRILIMESIRESKNVPVVVTKIFSNKPVFYARAMADNYFSYLSYDFLFSQTTSPVREVVNNTGFLYLIELPFLLIGLYKIIRNKIKWGYLTLGWLLIVPLGLAPFILESPNIHRALLFIYPLELIIAFGIFEFFEIFKKNKRLFQMLVIFLILGFIFEFFNFWQELFIHQPVHKPWARNYPYKQLISDLKKYESKYDKIAISTSDTNVYMYYLFYNKFDPKKYQKTGSHGNEDFNNIGKYYFVHIPCADNMLEFTNKRHILFVNQASCGIPIRDYKLIETISWGDRSPALLLIEYSP